MSRSGWRPPASDPGTGQARRAVDRGRGARVRSRGRRHRCARWPPAWSGTDIAHGAAARAAPATSSPATSTCPVDSRGTGAGRRPHRSATSSVDVGRAHRRAGGSGRTAPSPRSTSSSSWPASASTRRIMADDPREALKAQRSGRGGLLRLTGARNAGRVAQLQGPAPARRARPRRAGAPAPSSSATSAGCSGGCTLMPDARVDDGLLDVVVISPSEDPSAGRRWQAKLAHPPAGGGTRWSTTTRRPRSRSPSERPEEVQVDGDSIGQAVRTISGPHPTTSALVVRVAGQGVCPARRCRPRVRRGRGHATKAARWGLSRLCSPVGGSSQTSGGSSASAHRPKGTVGDARCAVRIPMSQH